MPFVKNNLNIESWLRSSHQSFELLDDAEYKKVLNNWKNKFDWNLEHNKYTSKGENAMIAMESLLPFGAFIFNFPGYGKLPAPANRKEKAYGYHVKSLQIIDRMLFNQSDSIVCDSDFHCTCIYTHEWQGMAAPQYYEKQHDLL